MMKDGQFPAGSGPFQLLLGPAQLGRVEIRGVEHENVEQAASILQRVIVSAPHIKQRIVDLISAALLHIVIAQHGMKGNTILEQCCKGLFEMRREVAGTAVRIDVVTGENREIERRLLVGCKHLSGDIGLITVSGPAVSNYRKA